MVTAVIFLFVSLVSIHGQTPVLVKDISPGSSHSNPLYMTAFQDRVFFIADDGEHGQEPWISNGTESGTSMILDMYPGTDDPFYARNPMVAGGLVYFIGNDGINGGELWVSDGSAEGTKMLKDLYPGKTGSMLNLSFMVEMGGMVYFAPREGGGGIPNTRGTELWKTDGTSDGTVIVKDIVEGGNSSLVNHMVATSNHIYFSAQNNEFGNELWVSDGTEEGTIMVADINEGSSSSNPEELTVAGSFIYFFATDGIRGRELWRTDGTGDGTILVKDINPGEANSNSDYMLGLSNGMVFFNADDGVSGDELWVSTGPESTTLIEINPGEEDSGPRFFTLAGGKVVFSADENMYGRELWISDGTAEGTILAADINVGSSPSFPANLITTGSVVYLATNQGVWRSNGTVAGTYSLTHRGQGVDGIRGLAISGNTLFFNGNGFDVDGELLGYELFKVADLSSSTRVALVDLQHSEISIYPNPVLDLLTIKSAVSKNSVVELRNTSGQLLYQKKMQGKQLKIDVSTFSNGIYIISLSSSDGFATGKIIKQ